MKKSLFLLLLSFVIACSGDKEKTSTNELTSSTETAEISYSDSIQNLSSKIGSLQENKLDKQKLIDDLLAEEDSLKNALKNITESLAQVEAKKIDPGISGVNNKLNELKGQEEGLTEQKNLQIQQISLAEKKITLLAEEKSVYDAQKKVLWDKGAAPAEFKDVDSSLALITKRIEEEKSKVKNLTRSVGDISEKVTSIGEQRASLSQKIRNNYTAKEIFASYSDEETTRLKGQIKVVNQELDSLMLDENELTSKLALQRKKKNELEGLQTLEELDAKKALSALEEQNTIDQKKKNRITFALVGIGIIALLLIVFYLFGKMKKKTN